MNYEKLYYRIIDNRKLNPLGCGVYGEKHHIIPKCLGGNDKKENIIKLTAREHFLCHYCLVKMYEGDKYRYPKMVRAFMMMKAGTKRGLHEGQRYLNSRLYESLKQEFSRLQRESQSGKNSSQYGKTWIYNLDLRQSKKIYKNELDVYLDKGWMKGRIIDFDLYYEKSEMKKERIETNKQKKINERYVQKTKYNNLYILYQKFGYKYLIDNNIYTQSNVSLYNNFRKYVDNYKPNRNLKKYKLTWCM